MFRKSKNAAPQPATDANAADAPSVADIFRRAQEIRRARPQTSYKDLRAMIADEYAGRPFPSTHNLTIPEQDNRAPEEDWSAGLSIIARGIQRQDWNDVATGIVLCLEQTEGYEREHGNTGSRDEWHDRTVGIRESLTKGVNKWMPAELQRLAEQAARKK